MSESDAIYRVAEVKASERYPELNSNDEMLVYPRSVIRDMARGGFIEGAIWAANHVKGGEDRHVDQ